MNTAEAPDVLVVGGGNAGLCAALSASDRGARVLLLERTPRPWRGGNSKYTRDVRVAGPDYDDEEFLQDLVEVTREGTDLELASFTIARSRELPGWMEAHGIRWQPPLGGTLQLSRTNRFFLGGGKAMLNAYYAQLERSGVEVAYDSKVSDLRLEDGRFVAALVEQPDGQVWIPARSVVLASGGFEANLDWLRRSWGAAADNYQVRGSRANDGLVLSLLLARGAMERGNPRGFHCVACDARSPQYEGGIVTRVDSVPFGIVVNNRAERFHDEGEQLWPKRYARWGGLVAEQPDQIAYSIFDSQAWGQFLPPLYPPYKAGTIAELAGRLELDAAALQRTVDTYNAGVKGGGGFDPKRLDGLGTCGVTPPKSNWARRLDQPPYYGYPMRPGVTFTYLAVGVDQGARVLRQDGTAWPNVFAAGEIMAGNVLRQGYLAGFGLTIGSVFGRIAGEEAARCARAA
ncbi:MAG: FAD-dependent tricarballylate dehydrogenase TcuA [Candidatus Dormibacteraeota bacterium]|nr:FAD-dependent tricarballylate dehydrogenase TcuA [Candidatus Dormibacteraeota bacterium]